MKEEFYTQKRWLNWMNKVRESQFRLPESEKDATGAVFVYIMDDVILACLKVIARFEKGMLSQDAALETIRSIRDIVSAEHESLGDGCGPDARLVEDIAGRSIRIMQQLHPGRLRQRL